jgi:predicted lysophospholipase L1 biosynthesis ABC-type transport system permease subunit
MSSVYQINKGINKSIEFRGLRAQYITYLAIGLVSLLMLFAILYVIGTNMYLCLALVFGAGTGLVMYIFRLSHKYGQYGLMKRRAKCSLPGFLYFNSRHLFIPPTGGNEGG